jgi:hypothetical protein
VQYLPRIAKAIFSVADGGLLLAQTGSGMTLSQLTWLDRKGRELAIAGTQDPRIYQTEHYSMDGFTAEVPNGKYTVITNNKISGAAVYVVSTPCFVSGNQICQHRQSSRTYGHQEVESPPVGNWIFPAHRHRTAHATA